MSAVLRTCAAKPHAKPHAKPTAHHPPPPPAADRIASLSALRTFKAPPDSDATVRIFIVRTPLCHLSQVT